VLGEESYNQSALRFKLFVHPGAPELPGKQQLLKAHCADEIR
jgi:hypothetical protein